MIFKNRRYIFDGGFGTMLQRRGMKAGAVPEELNITHRELIRGIHREYRAAGAEIMTANTFGANPVKLKSRYSLEEIITAAVENARSAGGLTALDVGPTGALLKPVGELDFEDAYAAFYEVARLGAAAGADLIVIETMSDTLEAKAAILAAKDACGLPVLASMTFDEKGKTLTGADPECMTAIFEGLGVDALGINCGLGPAQILPLAKRLTAVSSVPVLIQPNAGLPKVVNGETVYDVGPEEFGRLAAEFARLGVKHQAGRKKYREYPLYPAGKEGPAGLRLLFSRFDRRRGHGDNRRTHQSHRQEKVPRGFEKPGLRLYSWGGRVTGRRRRPRAGRECRLAGH